MSDRERTTRGRVDAFHDLLLREIAAKAAVVPTTRAVAFPPDVGQRPLREGELPRPSVEVSRLIQAIHLALKLGAELHLSYKRFDDRGVERHVWYSESELFRRAAARVAAGKWPALKPEVAERVGREGRRALYVPVLGRAYDELFSDATARQDDDDEAEAEPLDERDADFDLDTLADLHGALNGCGPTREMTVLERWPESVVAFRRVDRVTWSKKAGRFVIWEGYDLDRVRAYRDTGHVRFSSKVNSNKAGRRGAVLCRWASLLNWRMLSSACFSFGDGEEIARAALSLRPDQDWLRVKARPASDDARWRYMVPTDRYRVTNAERRGLSNLRAFYGVVLKQDAGKLLASLPLDLAREVVGDFKTREDLDLVLPELAANADAFQAIARAASLHHRRHAALVAYLLLRTKAFSPEALSKDALTDLLGHKMSPEKREAHQKVLRAVATLSDYGRLCAAAGARPMLRARSFAALVAHHDELAKAAAAAREREDLELRRLRAENFKLHPDFDVLESDDVFEVEAVRTLERLELEGAEMRHCVGGYADAVSKGKCGIFSVRRRDGSGRWTLELQRTFGGAGDRRAPPPLVVGQFRGRGPQQLPAPDDAFEFVRRQLKRVRQPKRTRRLKPTPEHADRPAGFPEV